MGEAKRRKIAHDAAVQERIDLFGDGSGVTATICRPERRSFLYRKHAEYIASAVLKSPAPLCLDFTCHNEIHSLDGIFAFVSSTAGTPPITMFACQACSKKSDDDILKIIRIQMADHFKIDRGTDTDSAVTAEAVAGIGRTIHVGPSCQVAKILSVLLADRRLPRFVFAFSGHNNCFTIAQQLYLDFRDLGIEDCYTYKIGFCSILKKSGEPIGWHSWIECDGWAIDGSGGAVGNPLTLERCQAYYDRLKMTDVKDVKSNVNGLVFVEEEMERTS